jgi:hypothetical protein
VCVVDFEDAVVCDSICFCRGELHGRFVWSMGLRLMKVSVG